MSGRSREHHIRVPRTARYHTLGDPATAPELWFVLHGYRQLAARFIRRFEALPGIEEGRRAVIAPEALSRFYVERETGPHGPGSRVGASWMTREDREHEIRDYVGYLDLLAREVLAARQREAPPTGAAPTRVVVLGFSQGSETASRWVGYGVVPAAELILWGGGLAEDLDVERARPRLAATRLRFVVGHADPWAERRSAESLAGLREAGLDAAVVRYDGGHRIDPDVLARHWGGDAAAES